MKTSRLSLLYSLTKILNKNQFGFVDYELAKFFIEHYQEIPEMNIYDIAELNHVSRASVRRFAQQIGYQNFAEMKQHYTDFDDGVNKYRQFYKAQDFRQELHTQIDTMFQELSVRMNSSEVNVIVDMMIASSELVIISSSTIASSIRTFQQEMAIFGKRITLVTTIADLEKVADYLDEKSLIIAFSTSGLLLESMMEQFIALQGKKVVFTLKRDPLYNKWFDKIYHFKAAEQNEVSELLYYTYAITYVLDVIFSEYLKKVDERD